MRSLGAQFRLPPTHGVSTMQRSGFAFRNLFSPRSLKTFPEENYAINSLRCEELMHLRDSSNTYLAKLLITGQR